MYIIYTSIYMCMYYICIIIYTLLYIHYYYITIYTLYVVHISHIMGNFLPVFEFFYFLSYSLVTCCSLKINFLSIVTPRSFWESAFSSMPPGIENFVLMSRLDGKWHLFFISFHYIFMEPFKNFDWCVLSFCF